MTAMLTRPARAAIFPLLVLLLSSPAWAQAPVRYRLTFDDREHRILDVEATFAELPAGPLELRMSRSSPGRYALHEFAKNVFDVTVTDDAGRPLPVVRPNPHQWDVIGHAGTVRVRYRVYGDRVDGTYLAVSTVHAHINMPAALLWARGLEARPAVVRFELPEGSPWRVATQLLPGPDAQTFTAPNLQYLMDSPAELSDFALRTFSVPDGDRTPSFRLVLHHTGSDGQVDALARDVERIVREARTVFGEYPAFEGGTYTFIADYGPWANRDGMEHRNSTILTSAGGLDTARADIIDTVSHEFFHAWNVERIRPKSLEPFTFEETNMSGELWLAEGFTSYYGPLILSRAGLTTLQEYAGTIGWALNEVLTGPGRAVHTLEEMSRLAPLMDAATAIDRTTFDNTFVSYYTWGSAVGLGLDLTLRARSDGRVTLDHLMRLLWERHGKPGGRVPGYVDRPYTLDDVKDALASVSGDAAFADDFFRRYIQGHEVMDYPALLERAGLLVRKAAPGRGWVGDLRLQDANGARISAAAPFGSPAYAAGLDREDVIVSLAGRSVSDAGDVARIVQGRKPGESIPVVFVRQGERLTRTITLAESPRVEVVPVEETGQSPTAAQRRFRDAWLSSVVRNSF